MKTTAEKKIEISKERDCILVEASKLSLSDDFMLYEPKTKQEKEFKDTLTKVITNGIKDFYRPTMDPSFADKEKSKIHYKFECLPALSKPYYWWIEIAKDSKCSIGTKSQYVAFLGVLIKMLVSEGWKVSEAWDAVCNDSKKLGHYSNSDNAKTYFEYTGSREICGFFDLANTQKILAKDEKAGGFWLAGGDYSSYGFDFPLADLGLCKCCSNNLYHGVAWLVLKK